MLEYSYLTSVLVSDAQQNDSAICVHISNLFQVLFHLGCSKILSRVSCAIQWSLSVIHVKYSSMKLVRLKYDPSCFFIPLWYLELSNSIIIQSLQDKGYNGVWRRALDTELGNSHFFHILLGRNRMTFDKSSISPSLRGFT